MPLPKQRNHFLSFKSFYFLARDLCFTPFTQTSIVSNLFVFGDSIQSKTINWCGT